MTFNILKILARHRWRHQCGRWRLPLGRGNSRPGTTCCSWHRWYNWYPFSGQPTEDVRIFVSSILEVVGSALCVSLSRTHGARQEFGPFNFLDPDESLACVMVVHFLYQLKENTRQRGRSIKHACFVYSVGVRHVRGQGLYLCKSILGNRTL